MSSIIVLLDCIIQITLIWNIIKIEDAYLGKDLARLSVEEVGIVVHDAELTEGCVDLFHDQKENLDCGDSLKLERIVDDDKVSILTLNQLLDYSVASATSHPNKSFAGDSNCDLDWVDNSLHNVAEESDESC